MAPDLPGRGDVRAPTYELSIQGSADRAVGANDEQGQPVIFVGHGIGGIVVSLVSEAWPEEIEKFVYLTGFLLEDDHESIVLPDLVPSEDGGLFTFGNPKDVFYADGSYGG